jgi:hypothetical protein
MFYQHFDRKQNSFEAKELVIKYNEAKEYQKCEIL